jgi:hypothetical protein
MRLAKRMLGPDAVFEVDAVAEKLLLRLVDAHHTRDGIATDLPSVQTFFGKVDLGNRPSRCTPTGGRGTRTRRSGAGLLRKVASPGETISMMALRFRLSYRLKNAIPVELSTTTN